MSHAIQSIPARERWRALTSAISNLHDELRNIGCDHPVQIVLHPSDRLAVSVSMPFEWREISAGIWPQFQYDSVLVTYQDTYEEGFFR